MDIYKRDVRRAIGHLDQNNPSRASDVARGFVENVKTWRGIQESFTALLNGLVSELEAALGQGNPDLIARALRAINEAYEGRRLAVETQLKKSRI